MKLYFPRFNAHRKRSNFLETTVMGLSTLNIYVQKKEAMNGGGIRPLYLLLLVVMCIKSNMENHNLSSLCLGMVPIKWTTMNNIMKPKATHAIREYCWPFGMCAKKHSGVHCPCIAHHAI
jgi:hypothetical protein